MVTLADTGKLGARGKISNIPVMFRKSQAVIDFIILHNVPFNVLIGFPALNLLDVVMDFKA